jgi:hypothetical protein
LHGLQPTELNPPLFRERLIIFAPGCRFCGKLIEIDHGEKLLVWNSRGINP